MTEATKGPWRVEGNIIMATWETGEPVQVATLSTTRWSEPDGGRNDRMRAETRANAALIAAAPDLLAWLKVALEEYKDRIPEIEAVIRRAEES